MTLHRSEIRAADDDDANHRANPIGFDRGCDTSTDDPPPNPGFDEPIDDSHANDAQENAESIHRRINADGTAIHRWGAARAAWKPGTWRLVSATAIPRPYEVSWGGDAAVSFVFTSSPEKLLVKKAKGGADWIGTRAPDLKWK